MPLISVIVPIYNVAPYLKECLDSLLSQTHTHLEIIMVNDGSTDESESIAREYLSDPRFSLICKENGGLSSARNFGMSKASGDFIGFIDSDDYVDKSYFECMLEAISSQAVDFVCNDNIVYFSSSKMGEPRQKESLKVCVPDSSNICFGGAVWRFLFSAQFLKTCGVQFLEGKIYEDEAFLFMIAPLSSKFVRFVGKPYYYRRREDSIMARHKHFRSYDLLDVFEEIFLFWKARGLLERFNPPYYFLYHSALGYENEKEYLYRAVRLARKLRLEEYTSYCQEYGVIFHKNIFFLWCWAKVAWHWGCLKRTAIRSAHFVKRKLKFWQ